MLNAKSMKSVNGGTVTLTGFNHGETPKQLNDVRMGFFLPPL